MERSGMSGPDGERVRLLFAIDNLRHGGAQKMLRAVLSRLNRERAEPAIWCLGGTSGIESWYSGLGVEVIRFPAWQMWCGIGLGRMYLWMRRRRPSLVQTFLFHADVFGRVLARLAGVRAVVSSVRATNRRKRWWQLGLDRLTAPLADRVIAVSHATRDFAVAREGAHPGRTVVIPNGVDCAAFEPGRERDACRAELGYGREDFVVGTIGRLHEQKGQVYLLEALCRLAPRHPRLRGFIVGYGPLEKKLKGEVRRMGLSACVRLLGYRTDVGRLLAAMDLFVLPSLWEGMPNVVLEAMAMALPVVATAVDGSLELVVDDETGILVPPKDPAALAQAIEKLAGDRPGAASMGRRGRRRAEREFSLERTTGKYLELYEQLLAEKAGRPRARLGLGAEPRAPAAQRPHAVGPGQAGGC